MTSLKTLREIATRYTERRCEAVAQAEGYEQVLAQMLAQGTHGERDVEWTRKAAETADRLANELAEAEHHAWDAYEQASQQEHEEYLAWQDSEYGN